jgi:surface antigen
VRGFRPRPEADRRHAGRRRHRGSDRRPDRRWQGPADQLIATSVGTLLGAFVGNEAGKSLDRADRLYASRAEYEALEHTPTGSSTPWRNPDTGHYGSVTPIETYEAAGGQYCREFQHQAQIGGRSRDVYGTACRTPDGQWQMVY